MAVTPTGDAIQGEITAPVEVFSHAFDDQPAPSGVVEVAEINTSSAGEVQIENEDGDVIGSAEFDEGLNENVRVFLNQEVEPGETVTSVLINENGAEITAENARVNATIQEAEGDEPLYLVNNLQPLTATAAPGDTLDISADITNRGGEGDGSGQTITLTAGPREATQDVTVAPGETETVTFEDVEVPSVEQETTVTHAISSADDSAEGSLTISPPDPANFQITEYSPQSATVSPGDEVTAEVTIENTGDVEGTQTVTFSANTDALDDITREVTISAGSSVSESFTFNAPEVDETVTVDHTLTTDDDEASGTLTIEVEEPPADGNETDEPPADGNETEDGGDGSSDDGGPGFGIAAALVAIIGAALLAYRRQQN